MSPYPNWSLFPCWFFSELWRQDTRTLRGSDIELCIVKMLSEKNQWISRHLPICVFVHIIVFGQNCHTHLTIDWNKKKWRDWLGRKKPPSFIFQLVLVSQFKLNLSRCLCTINVFIDPELLPKLKGISIFLFCERDTRRNLDGTCQCTFRPPKTW